MNIAIILAGGDGSRVGADKPKQFVEILGKPVLAYTIEIFQKNKSIDAIEVVCHQSWMDYCRQMIDVYNLSKVKWIVPGGETFQDSVVNGINHLKSLLSVKEGGKLNSAEVKLNDNIYIQYGSAPFTSQKIVNAVIEMTEECGSAVTATPCYQLMGTKDSDTTSKYWVDRDKYIQIACPQGFQLGYILDIYKRAREQGLLETIEPHTTSLIHALGDTIHFTYGDQTNVKITTAEDLELFEGYVLMMQRRK